MMRVFFRKLALFLAILCLPAALLFIPYVYFDPFKVIRKYDHYHESGPPQYVALNADYVAVETFIRQYPIYFYDSFIVGNSRSRFYEVEAWHKHIDSDRCFHFDASNETLYGIYKKIEFLHKRHIKIMNALIVMDISTLRGVSNSTGHLFVKHPLLSGQSSRGFQLEFLRVYCSFNFFPGYFSFKISGKEKDSPVYTLHNPNLEYSLKSNEIRFKTWNDSIRLDPSHYYAAKSKTFYARTADQIISPPVIKEEQVAMLTAIQEIFKEAPTQVKIVISPLYDQIKLNKHDLEILKNIFGAENVSDFSGINPITVKIENYYESSHYRPEVAAGIMDSIYGNHPVSLRSVNSEEAARD